LTWNVNSVRIRLERLLGVLERHQPDVACLQELKVDDSQFPALEVRAAGYHAEVFGQRTYNGIAILSKALLSRVTRSFRDGIDDPQARFLAADVEGVRVLSAYVPNGGEVGSDKWEYKLEWIARLGRYLDENEDPAKPLALCGDFNVAPDDLDVKNPDRWRHSVLCEQDGRAALANVVAWGLVDAFRLVHPEGGYHSWWDYRMRAFPKDDGLRIDSIYVTRSLAQRVSGAHIDREERKGRQPSDHAPLIVDFA
jgi:exodeoxyribonuclease-3